MGRGTASRPDIASAFIAICITVYFWWQNTKGIEESSEKALDIMKITTVMVVILLGWGIFTVVHRGAHAASAADAIQSAFQLTMRWAS